MPPKIYIAVPFKDKEIAKSLGAKWDNEAKTWFAPVIYAESLLKMYKTIPPPKGFEDEPLKLPEIPKDILRENLIMNPTVYLEDAPTSEIVSAKSRKMAFDLWGSTPSNNKDIDLERTRRVQPPDNFPLYEDNKITFKGEECSFGGNLLYVDLVPESSWCDNVRSAVAKKTWDIIRRASYARVQGCECCGSTAERLEAHERWGYDDKKLTQTLKRIIALCHNCHMVTHFLFGLNQGADTAKASIEHMLNVRTDLSVLQVQQHFLDATQLWEERSRKKWKVDLTMLHMMNVPIESEGKRRKN